MIPYGVSQLNASEVPGWVDIVANYKHQRDPYTS